jgi:hypothetical protein
MDHGLGHRENTERDMEPDLCRGCRFAQGRPLLGIGEQLAEVCPLQE